MAKGVLFIYANIMHNSILK